MTNKFHSGQNSPSKFWLGTKAKKKLNGNLIFRKAKLWTSVFLVDFLLKLKRVKIIEAKTDEEKEMVYKLRYDIYNECDYIDPKDFPDKKLKDEDDNHSISYLALRKNNPVGTVRLVLGNKKEDFPTFRMWNVDFDKFSAPIPKIGEISKLCIKKSERRCWIWLGMMKKVFQKSKLLNCDYWVFSGSFYIGSRVNKKFNTPVYSIPYLKETEMNLKERIVVLNFFESFSPSAYFLKVKEIATL